MEPLRDPSDNDGEPEGDALDAKREAEFANAQVQPDAPDDVLETDESSSINDLVRDAAAEMAHESDRAPSSLDTWIDATLTQAIDASLDEASIAAPNPAIPLATPSDGTPTSASTAIDIPQSPKRPHELIRFEFGPRDPVVFVDPDTQQQVRPTPTDDDLPPHMRRHPLRVPPPDDVDTPDLNVGMSRPLLVITMHRADRHSQEAFEAQAERWVRLMRDIADDRVADERERLATEERAIFGDY